MQLAQLLGNLAELSVVLAMAPAEPWAAVDTVRGQLVSVQAAVKELLPGSNINNNQGTTQKEWLLL